MALEADSEENGPASVVQLNRFPFFNEHLTCFHILKCPFQGNGILYNAINTLKAWNHSASVQFNRGACERVRQNGAGGSGMPMLDGLSFIPAIEINGCRSSTLKVFRYSHLFLSI